METKDLIANLHEWHENLISEMCADDVLTCDDLCGYPGPCIVIQAANLLEAQQKRIAELEAALRDQDERRWIPVTERLPEIGRKCLIANGEIVKVGWIRRCAEKSILIHGKPLKLHGTGGLTMAMKLEKENVRIIL